MIACLILVCAVEAKFNKHELLLNYIVWSLMLKLDCVTEIYFAFIAVISSYQVELSLECTESWTWKVFRYGSMPLISIMPIGSLLFTSTRSEVLVQNKSKPALFDTIQHQSDLINRVGCRALTGRNNDRIQYDVRTFSLHKWAREGIGKYVRKIETWLANSSRL